MAADGWRGTASVKERLLSQGHRFDFYKAVALIEAIAAGEAKAAQRPAPVSVGEGSDPERESVRFGAAVGFGFPPGDVVDVSAGEGDGWPAEMSVAFFSLVGGLGPMPEPIADLVQRSTVNRDLGPVDFLDIFHHRLISLRYRIKKHHRPALAGVTPDVTRAADHLFALMGLWADQPDPAAPPRVDDGAGAHHEDKPLRRSLSDGGRGLLHFAGLFTGQVRSMAGLEVVLKARFGLHVKAAPLTGCFRALDPSEQTLVGPSGQNRRLGDSATLGRRAWDQQGAFELSIGPLSLDALLRLLPASDDLPAGDMLAPFCEVVRFYAGPAHEVTLRLLIAPEAAPQAALGRAASRTAGRGDGPRLGFTSWLGRRRDLPGALEVRLPPEVLRDAVR